MVASAAEKNLSCFSSDPLLDAEGVLVPTYLSLVRFVAFGVQYFMPHIYVCTQARYLKNPWGNSKHCLSQFTSPQSRNGKSALKEFKQTLGQAKDYDAFPDADAYRGEKTMKEIEEVVRRRLASLVSEPRAVKNKAVVVQTLGPDPTHIPPAEPLKEVQIVPASL